MTDQTTWLVHCEDEFEWLADHDPAKLLNLITSGTLTDPDLTFAAEYAGLIGESAIPYLVPLLDHPKAYVREGAIIGLQATRRIGQHPEVLTKLRQLAGTDPSEALREVALEALDYL